MRVGYTITAVLLATVFVACAKPAPEVEQAEDDGPAFTYVSVGASETVGEGANRPSSEAWTSVLHRETMPRAATFVNVGVSGSTVRQALDRQVVRAVDEEPAVVTVWLNVNDIIRFVPVADYERDLAALVVGLRRDGKTQVLVANTPPVEDFPVVRACMPDPPPGVPCRLPVRLPGPEPVVAIVQQYNDAIARVVAREGAVLVDLQRAGVGARGAGLQSYFAADGFHPSTQGHRAVAEVFAQALKSTAATARFSAPPG